MFDPRVWLFWICVIVIVAFVINDPARAGDLVVIGINAAYVFLYTIFNGVIGMLGTMQVMPGLW